MNIFKGKLKVIDISLRVCISVLTLMASNVYASVSAPATDPTGDFKVTWTNTASSTSSSCNGNAYEVKEYKNGSYQRQLNISSTSQKYVDIYDRDEATYRYDVKYRSCSGSAKSMLVAGSATVLVIESSINSGFGASGHDPDISYGANDETIGLTPE
ncbi:hypothetical protein [Psychrosphaera algicola]|uniref:Fibronectin type-III domain-containing protein n=1 Tax=Psychrosphaera algicola TaxID=3023714 RepID=A0ABT5FGJ8_9GAMM|nr:hypothetical protein [Psychrosphaera sp. G1-22]MDC2890349.1 hypothetical protein [Psychrosphaera sp. G1-22]